jgi:hypothetical protein
MKALKSTPSSWRYKEDFRRIGDLVNFEGPELSVFERKDSQEIFIFDWVDHDDSHNRWLLFEVEAKDVLEFIFRKITHLQLFERANPDRVLCLEINNEKGFSNLPIFHVEEIPSEYFPNPVFFDKKYCPDFDQLYTYLRDRVSNEKQENRLSVRSQTKFENLLPRNKGYNSNRLVHTAPIGIMYSKDHQVVPPSGFDYTKIYIPLQGKWLIPDTMIANLKSYGLANAC